MKHFIKHKDQEWPLDFSMATLALFSRDDGKKLDDLLNGIEFDLLSIMRFLYWSVKGGCEKEKKQSPFDNWKDAAAWVEEEPTLAGEFLSEYYKSQGLSMTDVEKEGAESLGKPKA
jgi:hypothetical protein